MDSIAHKVPSVHGIFQARILEWVAISFSRASSWSKDQTLISYIGRWVLCCWATREDPSVSSVAQSCPTLCHPMDRSTPGLPVHHQLPELAQTHDHWVGDAIQPSHSLSSPSPPAFNLAQHQGLFQWVSSSNYVANTHPIQSTGVSDSASVLPKNI